MNRVAQDRMDLVCPPLNADETDRLMEAFAALEKGAPVVLQLGASPRPCPAITVLWATPAGGPGEPQS